MAAITVDDRMESVLPPYHALVLKVDIATTLDTFVTGYNNIFGVFVGPGSNISGWSASGGTITFTISSAVSDEYILVLAQ